MSLETAGMISVPKMGNFLIFRSKQIFAASRVIIYCSEWPGDITEVSGRVQSSHNSLWSASLPDLDMQEYVSHSKWSLRKDI